MILLVTDFGAEGPYLGQMEAVLRQEAPGVDVIKLLSNAPSADPRLSAYLLAALGRQFPPGSIFLCVVDPGVGGDRLAVVLEADGRCFVGPDNGLLNTVAVHAESAHWRIIDWRPEHLSASFHGRDLFAPIAARIARGDRSWAHRPWSGPDLGEWPADLAEIVYVDAWGNAISGLRWRPALDGRRLVLDGHGIHQATTFCDVPDGAAFWYCNSMGLVEIAVNGASARDALGLRLGDAFEFGESVMPLQAGR